jgi:hypothetical protein
MATGPRLVGEIGRDGQVGDPLGESLVVRGAGLQEKQHREETKVYREDPEGSSHVKVLKIHPSAQIMLFQKQKGDDEAADEEKDPHAERLDGEPHESSAELIGKPRNSLAVRTEDYHDAHGTPPIKRGQIRGEPEF